MPIVKPFNTCKVMARFLYLNGKRLTKFDLGHLIDSIAPAWTSNAWLMEDVWKYDDFVSRLVYVAQSCSNRRLIEKLSFYYPMEADTPSRFFEDINAYYR